MTTDFRAYSERYPGDDPDDIFERYAVTQFIKPKELNEDEISAGIVDGGKDGGIDSFFVFLNGSPLSSDDPRLTPEAEVLRHLSSHPQLEVFLIQAKNRERWEEAVWEHLLASLPQLLNASAEDAELEKLYRPEVVEQTGILRKAVNSLALKFPKITFRTAYVTRAPEENITPSVHSRADQVRDLIKARLTSDAVVTVEHIGIKGLYTLAGTDYGRPHQLVFRKLLREADSYIGVARISDYLSFIRDEQGVLREEFFESNVRDYEGDNSVNEAIGDTLENHDALEFWWLNNGVTILGDIVESPQDVMTIKRPLIVNGLQTSHVLHRAAEEDWLAPERLDNGIVVRVIQSTDEETRDRVIAGTNRQTQVPGPALYATQQRQRDIERFLLAHNWYYERRKNRYKNQDKPAKRRITMNLLAQAMITLLLGQPDTARARPSTLLSRKDGYDSIFPDSLDVDAYLTAIELVKEVDEFLSTDEAKEILDEKTNARFYLAAGYAIRQLRLRDTTNFRFESNYRRLKRPLKKASLLKALDILAEAADSFQSNHDWMTRDSIFKSAEFREKYFEAVRS
ncbi:AIPR family protein [Micromonospora sp. NBRC 101691]|uniref:AIPR family protein n=1 Tax=Micromonospora sp. NBRC 101691 TaxID=3032198 RepID=UPI002556D4E2|nr:AIPR family protein [Micromonospora sp. NBRC 101691]